MKELDEKTQMRKLGLRGDSNLNMTTHYSGLCSLMNRPDDAIAINSYLC